MERSKLRVRAPLAARWVKNIPGMQDLELFVRPMNNPAYRRLYAELRRGASAEKHAGEQMPHEEHERIHAECLAHACLLGWRNYVENGQAVEFSPEKALAELTDEEMRDFHDAVSWATNKAREVDADEEAASEKN